MRFNDFITNNGLHFKKLQTRIYKNKLMVTSELSVCDIKMNPIIELLFVIS